jgi:putative membrane-bound dehydrogenase-like protein
MAMLQPVRTALVSTGALLLVLAVALPGSVQDEGVAPAGAAGKALNLDFETGTLADWTATGTAFEKQPVKGDTVASRRGDMKSEHRGDYWIGTYEVAGDAPQGTLTSAPFKVTHRIASFRVAGGAHESTRVEIVLADEKKVVLRISGEDSENLRPVVVDLYDWVGREVFIRLVDESSGGWGHINFDHFRFHEKRVVLPNQRDPNARFARDDYKHAGLGAEEAARAMTVPPGFSVTVFASEPEVVQPIAMALDERGRLWVAENAGYPQWQPPEKGGKCRVLVFEDENGDGKADRRTVFIDNINFISGLEVGHGGVWIGAPPFLLFVADRDRDDRPDGPPEPVLDGWEHQDTHETLNAFIWGPDGWLYGCHGVFTHSNVGKPGAPDSERQRINAGYWRYHPRKKLFEVFAEGCSNQWGIDFDDRGQAFATACVIPHLYHVIQGGRYQRQAGQHFNRHTYDDLKTIADHRHYVGSKGPHAANGISDAAGGGHAHCGAMCYLGDDWPEEYRGKLFFSNIHGARVNMDVLEPAGSGFIGRHGADFLLANDRSSQILNLRYGPDGAVYVLDWYDKQQCHTMNPKDHDPSNGRVFRISTRKPAPAKLDLHKLPGADLVRLHLHRNDWHVRHARKVLQERGPAKEVEEGLEALLANADATRVLRAMWTLHATGAFTEARALRTLAHPDPHVRAWSVQLSCEERKPGAALLAKFAALAREEPSPVVRLYLASAAQRLSLEERKGILEGLVARPEDAQDPNLPLLIWYAVEPVVAADVAAGAALAGKARIPKVREFIARRISAGNK